MKNKLFMTGLCAVMMLASCESELNISGISTTPKLVVNALINDKDFIEVQVSHTKSLGSGALLKYIDNADVQVIDDAGNQYTLTYDIGEEVYRSSFVAKAGKFYRIIVKAAGYRDVDADLVMPENPLTGKATWRDSTESDSSGFPTGTLTMSLNDRADVRNYYRISLFYYDEFEAKFKELRPVLNDEGISDELIRNEDGSILFDDLLFNGEQRKIEFVTPFGYATGSPKFLVVTENLSTNYYNYFKSLNDYRESESVFREPTPVFSNIRNGVGIWAGSSIARDTIR